MASLLSAVTPIIALLLILNFGEKAESCFCQPAHPQAMFCRSQFVIKALVGKSRVVELRPNGKFRKVNKDEMGPELDESEEPEVFPEPEGTSNPIEDLTEDENPAPFNGPVGPEGRTSGRNPSEESRPGKDDRHSLGAPGYTNTNDSARRKRSPYAAEPRYHAGYHVGGAPGMSYLPVDATSTIMIQYRISIVKVFKGLQNFTKQQRRFLYTPPVPLCSQKLSTDRKPHILMGHIHNGVLMLTMCDYTMELENLSERERKNAIRNMQTRYPKACPLCHVKVCDRNGCNKELKEPYCCEWKEWTTAQSPEASQYSCLQTKRGECKWYNRLTKTNKAGRS